MAPQSEFFDYNRAECLADSQERSSLDDRSYKVVKLSNKLEVLLIHDPDTDKASAAMDVNVGSFCDAKDMPGMAHAVEHLLFMGTKKFPKENDYNQYLTSHSGYSNAFTASTSTNYFFEVGAGSKDDSSNANGESKSVDSPLYGALDRFAQFFIAPLFLEETLDRELRAVDSENKKNLQNDTWRLHQLSRSLSNPDHPFCRFSTGNLQTLRDDPLARGVRIRDEFMKFHDDNYSANRMKLVVLGRESLQTLEEWVEQLFAGVVNKDLPQNRWDNLPVMTSQELQTEVFAKPVMDSRSLELLFEYEDEDEMFDTQPGRYISHLIGHEGPGSILAYLKAKGLANSLSAGHMPVCPGGGLFAVSITLTPEGLEKYRDVAKIVFQYISILHETEPQEWIFNESKEMADVDFRFKQKSPASSTTSGLSQTMQKPLPRNRLLSGERVMRTFDSAAIKNALFFIKTANVRLSIVSQKPLPGKVEKEKWYGTDYSVQRMPNDFINELKRAETSAANDRPQDLHLPHKNEFIPSKLEVEKKIPKEVQKTPRLIRNDHMVRLWYKKDDQFWVPKATVEVIMRNPVCGATPSTTMITQLFVELIHDYLGEYSYDAEIAGLAYNLIGYSAGLNVRVSGYNDKLSVLLEKVLVTLRDLEIKQDRFDIVKERMTRSYNNFEYATPYHQIGQHTRWLSSEKNWPTQVLLAELNDVSINDLRAFHPTLFRKLHLEMLVHGNLYREDALKLANLVEITMKPQTLLPSQWPIRRSTILPEGSNFLYKTELKDPSNVNHCIEYLVPVGNIKDRKLNAKLLLLAQMTDEPAFDQLRTKEQLGYVVFSGSSNHLTTIAYHVLIQSEKSPEYLEKRIDHFLRSFKTSLLNMSDEEFESHKRSIINKRLEKLKNLNQERARFWGHVTNEIYHFEENEDDVNLIKPLTKDDLVSFFSHYIDPSSTARAKISIHMLAKASLDDVAQKTSPKEQQDAISSLMGQFLEAQEITVEVDKLSARLENAKISEGDVPSIIGSMEEYMKEDAGVADEKVKEVTQQVTEVMPAVLPQLGIKVATPEVVENGDVDRQPEAAGEEPVIIEDVRDWKASLNLSTGATPISDLSRYEELEPKL